PTVSLHESRRDRSATLNPPCPSFLKDFSPFTPPLQIEHAAPWTSAATQPMATAAAAARFTPAILPRPRRRVPAPCASASSASGRGNRRLRCEFVASVGNGALSGEDDPRLIDRQKALDAAMTDINNSFGKGSVTRLGSAGGAFVYVLNCLNISKSPYKFHACYSYLLLPCLSSETFPSGCLTLDFALGGGLPKGRVVEVYGPESSGKTTLALHAIAEIQKLGGNAMLVDAEHAFDPAYSKALGVDIENLIVCQPDNGEMALEIADRMCRSGAIDLICIDSVSALTPRAEIEGEIGMQQMGLQARLMSQALRKMSGNASKAGCTLMFLNQIRYKIGVFYGNPEVTSGGIALKFFASVRLEIRHIGKIKSAKGDEDIGVKVRVRVQKSKVSRPYKQAEFEIMFGEGVSKLGCILDCAELMEVVAKKGSWYSYKDIRLGQGREKALQYLRENPTVCDEIEKVVRAMIPEGTRHMAMLAFGQSSSQPEEEEVYDD
uniref:RecA family profile 2 domain-containing protein n=4 Tax=Aegilops tauschii subsp. strangulata TaxID=200361 RepID=A0A453LQU1_AEGTS